MSVVIPTTGRTPLEILSYAAHYAAGYYQVAPECIALDVKRGRLVIFDRPHGEDGAEVTLILRASRTNSGVFFQADADGRTTGALQVFEDEDEG